MTTSTETRNVAGLTFKEWHRLADRAVGAACGLCFLLGHGLSDGPSWDAWNDDESPEDYASTILHDAGFPDQ